jgi:hypothetical protein
MIGNTMNKIIGGRYELIERLDREEVAVHYDERDFRDDLSVFVRADRV